MNHHKTSFTLEDSTTIIMAIIPTVLVSIISKIASKIENTFFYIVVMICSCFLSVLIAYLFYVFLKEKQEYNQYKEYEGKWLQYIPGFQRKFSICELKYSKRDGWKFVGTNIDDCNYESVMFDSYKFVGDGPNSFFYVTDARASYKPEKIEGFGKVYNLAYRTHGMYEGIGFFFDVSSALSKSGEKALQKAFLFKLSDDFYEYFSIDTQSTDFCNLTDEKLIELTKGKIAEYCEKRLKR